MHSSPTPTMSASISRDRRAGSWARRAAVRASLAFAAIVFLAIGPVAGAASAVPRLADATLPCSPGSGAKLAGHHLTADSLTAQQSLQCADLKGADLSGLSLAQDDFTGAVMTGANLSGADLTQATLTGADLSGADLTNADLTQATITDANLAGAHLAHAKLGQVTATDAVFTNADLSHVDFTQAELTGARLDHSLIAGTTFTQATLTGVVFTGARGLLPWSTYVTGIAVIVLAILILPVLRPKRLAFLARAGVRGFPTLIIGSLLIAFGVHLFLGGLVGLIAGGLGTPVTQTCSAPQCVVGVKAGILGPFAGTVAVIAGVAIKGMARSRSPQVPAPTSWAPAQSDWVTMN